MPGTKIRGKSAIIVNSNQNDPGPQSNAPSSLLKIESVVPKITNRLVHQNTTRKFIKRANSTLSSSLLKNAIHSSRTNIRAPLSNGVSPQPVETDDCNESTCNGNSGRIRRNSKEKEKHPDRINLDRRGLTSIPFIEDEHNLRLLSLQHNLINVFQVPLEKVDATPQSQTASPTTSNTTNVTSKKLVAQPSTVSLAKDMNRNILTATENKIHLQVTQQRSAMLKRSNSFIAGHPLNQKFDPRRGKLCHMMSFSSDGIMSPTATAVSVSNSSSPSSKISNIFHLPSAPPYTLPGFSASFLNLVFLDLYDNQIDRISNLDGLKSLTVLLLGKNRITDISGIISLKSTLRVLDLHGNKITNISQKICHLQELKSLNLAGNSLRQISSGDFSGMLSLKELNLKRNRIKKILGFDDLRNLERLWLCHNDLQRIDDMSCIAKALNLKEVTIENNPISLGGDCVSFLVSYLPNLYLLSQMQVTEQVKRAAMAWRKNKEISDSNYQHLSSDVCVNIRREEVISNARTSWELLRSQQITSKTGLNVSTRNVSAVPPPTPASDLDNCSNLSDNLTTKKILRHKPNVVLNGKDKKLSRSMSQDNGIDGSVTTSIANPVADEDFFRLPPILAPFLEKTFSNDKSNSQGSSMGPNVDSGSSHCSSDNEDVKKIASTIEIVPDVMSVTESKPIDTLPIETEVNYEISQEIIIPESNGISTPTETLAQLEIINIPPPSTPPPQVDNKSVISSKTSTSDSSSTMTNSSDTESKTTKIRSANPNRRYYSGSLVRAQTARGYSLAPTNESRTNQFNNISNITITNSSNNQQTSNTANGGAGGSKKTASSNDREREQGGDYLIEICGRYLNVYGLGALKFIDKQWNTQKANDVHTVKFSYINFTNIAVILYRIKVRFPNAENFVFRETNITCLGQLNALAEIQGINSLIIDPEGNSITEKNWRPYAIYRLSHWGLKSINSTTITEDEIQEAEQQYIGLSDLVVWSLPDALLQPLLTRLRLEENCAASKMSAKDWLMQADVSLKNVVGKEALQWKKTNTAQEEINARQKGRNQLTMMMENTCNAVEKLQRMENLWSSMLTEMVRNTLLDYSQIDAYVKNLMDEMNKK